MADNDPSAFILSWFEARGPVPGASAAEKLKIDYFDAGLIDSLTVVELVAVIEEKYGVRFTDAHFQERRFATIGGVAEITRELLAAAGKA